MSSIDTRSSFFPKTRSATTESAQGGSKVGATERNSAERTSEIQDRTGTDAKVSIGDGVKDFSRIKKAAMAAPDVDNTEKIARLKAQIAAGTYEVDYDGLADKILTTEF
ncbi:MAG: flagellar biosynthesis anti-sigma factor FlgM [Bdellovibrionales bacterium]|nr:flagellar biosynthesis anti-sigma factor FlgM [Bdellovibrionales bacterium]